MNWIKGRGTRKGAASLVNTEINLISAPEGLR